MHMGVEEAGQHHPPMEVGQFGVGSDVLLGSGVVTHVDDLAVGDSHGFGPCAVFVDLVDVSVDERPGCMHHVTRLSDPA